MTRLLDALTLRVHRDTMHREIRFEFTPSDQRLRSVGGVFDLPVETQRALLIDQGRLPGWGPFLPDFAIVYATGDPAAAGAPVWREIKVHVGGPQWTYLYDEQDPPLDLVQRRQFQAFASAEWNSVADLLFGVPSLEMARSLGRTDRPAGWTKAPPWLIDLIRSQTPWGDLLDAAIAGGPDYLHQRLAPNQKGGDICHGA